jgi:hypothetical protein
MILQYQNIDRYRNLCWNKDPGPQAGYLQRKKVRLVRCVLFCGSFRFALPYFVFKMSLYCVPSSNGNLRAPGPSLRTILRPYNRSLHVRKATCRIRSRSGFGSWARIKAWLFPCIASGSDKALALCQGSFI